MASTILVIRIRGQNAKFGGILDFPSCVAATQSDDGVVYLNFDDCISP